MTEIAIQTVRSIPPIDWRGVPVNVYLRFRNRVSAVCRSQHECEDLVHWFGAAEFCPFPPILIMVPGTGGILLCGFGLATAAELRDDAVGLWVLKSERMVKTGSLVDFDDLRERAGLVRRENVRDAVAEAFHERIRQHKENIRTDPFRQPRYPRWRGRTVFGYRGIEE